MTVHIIFNQVPQSFSHQPPMWRGAVYPYTFVISQLSGGRFAASANDSREGINKVRLGNGFTSLSAAQAACVVFLERSGSEPS